MKVCIVGGGAIGTLFAARLGSKSDAVSLITKRPLPQETGGRAPATLVTPSERIEAVVTVARDGRSIGPQDIVIVAVKAPALASVVETVLPLLHDGTTVIFSTNGLPWWYSHTQGGTLDGRQFKALDKSGRLWSEIGPERSGMAVVYAMSNLIEPAVVKVENPVSRIILGCAEEGRQRHLEYLCEHLAGQSGACSIAENIRDAAWEKLALLYASAPLSILAQAAPRELFADEACVALSKSLMREVISIANALDSKASIDPDKVIELSRNAIHKPSILQDLESGRAMEIDAIFTVPRALASAAGVAAPTLASVAALATMRARSAGLY